VFPILLLSPPEFKPPNKNGDLDTSNFDLEFTSERPEDSHVVSNMSADQIEKSKFDGFTYQETGGAMQ
jgi:serum/glucocorticoid-regulated kinase 2